MHDNWLDHRKSVSHMYTFAFFLFLVFFPLTGRSRKNVERNMAELCMDAQVPMEGRKDMSIR